MSAVVLTFFSCLNEDKQNVTYTDDIAISSFSIGTLKRTMYTKASDGVTDSVYTIEFNAGKYKFSIDHNNGTISNEDSLPIRTDVRRVVCTATAYNGGILAYRKPANDTIFYYNLTDSLDFTDSLEFRVYASDGTGNYRPYNTKINVHKQNGDSLYWMRKDFLIDVPKHKKLLVRDGECFVFDTDKDSGVMLFSGEFYAVHDGKLEKSANGKDWTQVAEEFPFKTLLGAGTVEMYALSGDGKIYSSYDGLHWVADEVDGDLQLLPSTDVSCICKAVKSNAETEKVILVGNAEGDGLYATVWTKVVEKRTGSDKYAWTMARYTMQEALSLKKTEGLSVAAYDDALVSLYDGKFYLSLDEGLIWKVNTSQYYLPYDFSQRTGCVALGASDKNIFLLEDNGILWQGVINRLTWKKKD